MSVVFEERILLSEGQEVATLEYDVLTISNEIESFLKLLPQHFQKENTLKFLNCFKPCLAYLENILNEDIGMSSTDKASGEYLDFIGFKMLVNRLGLLDEEFRPFLKMARFKSKNAPTTENLLNLTNWMTGYFPAEIYNYPNGEPASQYIKFIVPYTSDVSKFPDLNTICDAGARIYQDILSKAGRTRYNPNFTAGLKQLNMHIQEFEVPVPGGKNNG
ncbi:MAG: hypothetical protein RSB50_06370 [Cetobacterium sp.]